MKDQRGNIVGYSGLIFAMMDEIGSKLNFSYTVIPPTDGKFGIKMNGRWNGMIQQLINKEVRASRSPSFFIFLTYVFF